MSLPQPKGPETDQRLFETDMDLPPKIFVEDFNALDTLEIIIIQTLGDISSKNFKRFDLDLDFFLGITAFFV